MSETDAVSDDYLAARKLQKTAGALLLWGLGVGYVISGDFLAGTLGSTPGASAAWSSPC